MSDWWIELQISTSILTCVWIGISIATRHYFKEQCDWGFKDSVDFLNCFNKWGGNYVLTTVVICIIIPLLIYGGLVYSGNATIDVCFDADRLDLGRVGIFPEPEKMATKQGAYFAKHAIFYLFWIIVVTKFYLMN